MKKYQIFYLLSLCFAGSVILTEMEEQKIYTWVPQSEELKLISNDGPGTIKSIEFDEYSNNLYWIDPVKLEIKLMNLESRRKVTLLRSNTTYYPVDLTLNSRVG